MDYSEGPTLLEFIAQQNFIGCSRVYINRCDDERTRVDLNIAEILMGEVQDASIEDYDVIVIPRHVMGCGAELRGSEFIALIRQFVEIRKNGSELPSDWNDKVYRLVGLCGKGAIDIKPNKYRQGTVASAPVTCAKTLYMFFGSHIGDQSFKKFRFTRDRRRSELRLYPMLHM